MERGGMGMEKAVAQWLKKQPHPLALFACNDVRAQQVLNGCREHGVKVPEEVVVMGVDNDDVLDNLSEPSLTSIQPDAERVGHEAAALLARVMKGARVPMGVTQIPPLRIVERGSTDMQAVEDVIVAQALRYIRENLATGISVKEVLAHIGRSRTDMENRFRRALHATIHDEILRQRLEHARRLLRGLPAFFQEEMGKSQSVAGWYGTLFFNGAAFTGMLIGSVISDRWSRTNLRARALVPAIAFTLAGPIFFGCVHFSQAALVVVAGILAVGFAQGCLDCNLMPTVCTLTGARQRATAYGLLNFISTITGGLMTFYAGHLKDAHVSFAATFQIAGGMIFFAGLILLAVKPTQKFET